MAKKSLKHLGITIERAKTEDLPQILLIQSHFHTDEIDDKSNGYISYNVNEELLGRINSDIGILIAKVGRKPIGYIFAIDERHQSEIELINSNLQVLDYSQSINGTTIDAEKSCVMGQIAIDKGFHRLGVGTKLSEEIDKLLKRQGYRMIINGISEDNEASQSFGDRLGYKKIENREGWGLYIKDLDHKSDSRRVSKKKRKKMNQHSEDQTRGAVDIKLLNSRYSTKDDFVFDGNETKFYLGPYFPESKIRSIRERLRLPFDPLKLIPGKMGESLRTKRKNIKRSKASKPTALYNKEYIRGLILTAMERTIPGDKVNITIVSAVAKNLNGKGLKKAMVPAEQKKLVNEVLKEFPEEERLKINIRFLHEDPEYIEVQSLLNKENYDDFYTSDLLELDSETSALDYIRYLTCIASKDKTFFKNMMHCVPAHLKDELIQLELVEEDTFKKHPSALYPFINMGLKLHDVANGKTTHAGPDRERIIDDKIRGIINGKLLKLNENNKEYLDPIYTMFRGKEFNTLYLDTKQNIIS